MGDSTTAVLLCHTSRHGMPFTANNAHHNESDTLVVLCYICQHKHSGGGASPAHVCRFGICIARCQCNAVLLE
jgi:hypothetical protein